MAHLSSTQYEGRNDPLLPLLRRTLRGDLEARHALLQALTPSVRRAVQRRLGTPSEVDDAVQESLLAIVQALPNFRERCSVLHFAGRVASRRALTQQRRQRRHWPAPAPADWESEGLLEPSAEEAALAGRKSSLLGELFAKLPERQATALALRFADGCGLGEVAARTGVSVNTVRTRLRLGREALRRLIEADSKASELLCP